MLKLSLLVLLFSLTSQADDLGFRYKDGKCINDKNEIGYNPQFIGECGDLSGVVLGNFDLKGTNFSGAKLDNVNFSGSNLEEANFTGANLEGANLSGVNANGATFVDAALKGARLVKAKLGFATFKNSNLEQVNLESAGMTFSFFENVDMRGAHLLAADLKQSSFKNVNFSGIDLSGSDFYKSKFENTNFSEADLSDSSFKDTRIKNADFSKAILSNAQFDSSVIEKSDFQRANLKNINMGNAKVTDSKFRYALYSKNSKLPFDFTTAESIGMEFIKLFEFTGILNDVDPKILDGWKLCHESLYGAPSIPIEDVMRNCTGENIMLACREVSATNLRVAGYANKIDILVDDSSNTLNVQNNVGFYFSNDESIGFAEAGKTVDRNTCDVDGSGEDTRLCWHMGGGRLEGGYRCGSVEGLNSSTTWVRLIYTTEG